MPLGDHLRELRRRLVISLLGLLAASILGWYFYDQIVAFISAPVDAVRDAEGGRLVSLNFDTVTGAFTMMLKVSVFTGIIVSSPLWLWQGWSFLLPGMTRKEKRIAFTYFFAAIPLFIAGAALAAYTFPRLYAILLQFAPENFANLQSATAYLNLVLFFCLAFGIAFLLPIVLVALNQLGILSARLMLKGWRIALFLILVFSAFMTPDPSAVTMIFMAMPVFALYWGAVGMSFYLEKRKRKRAARQKDASIAAAPEQTPAGGSGPGSDPPRP